MVLPLIDLAATGWMVSIAGWIALVWATLIAERAGVSAWELVSGTPQKKCLIGHADLLAH